MLFELALTSTPDFPQADVIVHAKFIVRALSTDVRYRIPPSTQGIAAMRRRQLYVFGKQNACVDARLAHAPA
jgi:hypothetical protein